MRCPKCGGPTEVTDKRGAFRSRRCTDPVCRLEFKTCENLVAHVDDRRVGLRKLATTCARRTARTPTAVTERSDKALPAAQHSPLTAKSATV